MSGLGNNLPPRDSSGRFIKRPEIPTPQQSAESLEKLEPVPIPAPTPRLVAQPSELEPSPSPYPPAPPATPTHPATPISEAPPPARLWRPSLSPVSSVSSDSESPPRAPSWTPLALGQHSTNLAAPLRPLLLPRQHATSFDGWCLGKNRGQRGAAKLVECCPRAGGVQDGAGGGASTFVTESDDILQVNNCDGAFNTGSIPQTRQRIKNFVREARYKETAACFFEG